MAETTVAATVDEAIAVLRLERNFHVGTFVKYLI